MWDMLDDAIYKTVHDYRDGTRSGAQALAPRVNMNAGTLTNKANPGMETHHLTLRESIPLQLIANDYRIAEAYCIELGGTFLNLPDIGATSDAALLDIWARLAEEQGEAAHAIRMALDDGDVTRKELGTIKTEIHQAICVWLELYKRIESIYAQCERVRARQDAPPSKPPRRRATGSGS